MYVVLATVLSVFVTVVRRIVEVAADYIFIVCFEASWLLATLLDVSRASGSRRAPFWPGPGPS